MWWARTKEYYLAVKRNGSSDPLSMRELRRHHTKRTTRHKERDTVWFCLYGEPRRGKFMEKERRTEVSQHCKEKGWDMIFWFQSFRLWDEEVLEMDSGDGCTTLGIQWTPRNYTLLKWWKCQISCYVSYSIVYAIKIILEKSRKTGNYLFSFIPFCP